MMVMVMVHKLSNVAIKIYQNHHLSMELSFSIELALVIIQLRGSTTGSRWALQQPASPRACRTVERSDVGPRHRDLGAVFLWKSYFFGGSCSFFSCGMCFPGTDGP